MSRLNVEIDEELHARLGAFVRLNRSKGCTGQAMVVSEAIKEFLERKDRVIEVQA